MKPATFNFLKLMKGSLFFIICFWMLGCCPQQILTTDTRDSVRIEIVEKIKTIKDTIVVEIPQEKIVVVVPADSTSILDNSVAESTASLKDGKLTHSLSTKDVPIIKEVEFQIEYRDSIIYKEQIITNTIEVERSLTLWEAFQISGFRVLIGAVVLCGLAVAILKRL